MTTTFEFGNGPVPAHQHPNGGGWVADSASVADSAYVGPNARVFDNALVSGNAQVYGDAQVFGNARIHGNAQVYGDAQVFGNARIHGNASVSGYARVFGNLQIHGDSRVTKTPMVVRRTDSFEFCYVPCKDGKYRINAGCRHFTMEEAIEHWEKTRGGTELGFETMKILKALEILK